MSSWVFWGYKYAPVTLSQGRTGYGDCRRAEENSSREMKHHTAQAQRSTGYPPKHHSELYFFEMYIHINFHWSLYIHASLRPTTYQPCFVHRLQSPLTPLPCQATCLQNSVSH